MSDRAAFCHRCPFCEDGAGSSAEFALHLEAHFLEGADRWFRTILPRVVEHPRAEAQVSVLV